MFELGDVDYDPGEAGYPMYGELAYVAQDWLRMLRYI